MSFRTNQESAAGGQTPPGDGLPCVGSGGAQDQLLIRHRTGVRGVPTPPAPTPLAARLITEASQLTVRVTSEHVTLHIVKSQRNGAWRLVWGDSRLPAADPGLPIKTHKSVLNPTTGNSFKKKTKIRIKRVSREKTLRVLDDFLAKERREVCRWPASPRASSVRLRQPWHVVNTSH